MKIINLSIFLTSILSVFNASINYNTKSSKVVELGYCDQNYGEECWPASDVCMKVRYDMQKRQSYAKEL
ncbi:hypothetical protein PIROE2DRAFT_14193 [Piromyces sp. E2]|nr:hypothetical protein PIROE2DRAFT_14193 [Piromyces sp. E2]|eukprot:OUM60106.1 hypothetical protein PIROE2DRAFT_14193 [Piromyces sp. E2]